MQCRLFKNLFLFAVGGGAFYLLEVFWRGYSHRSMLMVGGLCFLLIGQINEHMLTWNMLLLLQMGIAAVMVTGIELIAGFIFNVWLGLDVWDYSALPGNLWGQICPQYTAIWFLLSVTAILLDDYIRHWFFGEEKPGYKLI
ncbi:MAG TPA: hypothetical protein DD738_15705 [Ruminiclostridium sp.]|mgnify:CR=1 FL=1|nr:hypothetical protein [Ruminiclostridium sp.]